LERVLDDPVHLLVLDGRARFHTAAPAPHDEAVWQAVMPALSSADRWGSCDTTEGPEIWAEIHEG
jgi:hypothetical protein